LNLFKDEGLEYDEQDILENYKEFYSRTVKELSKYGKIVSFVTCSNFSSHLRGNVYVEYQK
jgi:hypothetical protein